MTDTTYLIIGAAIVVLAVVLLILARTGRKPPEGPVVTQAPVAPLPEPVAEPEPIAAPVAEGPPQDLTRLKGLGPKAAGLLGGLGYTRYEQIAAWSDGDVARIDAHMGAFKGRIVRDRWVEQAGYLAKDDIAGFEALFGRLG